MKKIAFLLVLLVSLSAIGCNKKIDLNKDIDPQEMRQDKEIEKSEEDSEVQQGDNRNDIIESKPEENIQDEIAVDELERCIYMFDEYIREEYSVEYYADDKETKQAVYAEEYDGEVEPELVDLIPINEEVLPPYYIDIVGKTYYPVYNFKDKQELKIHYSNYFTKKFMKQIERNIDNSFFEFEGKLYVVRGARGYGAMSIDFDTIDYESIQDSSMLVNTLLFGEDDSKYKIEICIEDGVTKIDDARYLSDYRLGLIDPALDDVKVLDFMSFITNNLELTDPMIFYKDENIDGEYGVEYLGNYGEYITIYVDALKRLGYTTTIDGNEGFYSLEKISEDYIITVSIYSMNEEDGVVVKIKREDI